MNIILKDLIKSYSKQNVLKSLNLYIEGPQMISIIGPSGSGKTTLTE